MAKASIKIEKDLVNRAKKCAEVAGYSSTEEFVQHVLEKELAKIEESGTSDEDIAKSLQGLGYIE